MINTRAWMGAGHAGGALPPVARKLPRVKGYFFLPFLPLSFLPFFLAMSSSFHWLRDER